MWVVIRVVLLIAFIFIVIMDIAELILSKIYSDCNLGFICLLRFYNELSAELMEIESDCKDKIMVDVNNQNK